MENSHLSCQYKGFKLDLLAGVKVSRSTEFFGLGSALMTSSEGSYMGPYLKTYLVLLDAVTQVSRLFCSDTETFQHLFIQCFRLSGGFSHLQNWFQGLGEPFTFQLVIYIPGCTEKKISPPTHYLIMCQCWPN